MLSIFDQSRTSTTQTSPDHFSGVAFTTGNHGYSIFKDERECRPLPLEVIWQTFTLGMDYCNFTGAWKDPQCVYKSHKKDPQCVYKSHVANKTVHQIIANQHLLERTLYINEMHIYINYDTQKYLNKIYTLNWIEFKLKQDCCCGCWLLQLNSCLRRPWLWVLTTASVHFLEKSLTEGQNYCKSTVAWGVPACCFGLLQVTLKVDSSCEDINRLYAYFVWSWIALATGDFLNSLCSLGICCSY